MPFQSTVYQFTGLGVIGEMFTDSPWRAESYTLESADAAYNVFGRAFTRGPGQRCQAGSAGPGGFAGILVNPKTQALQGTAAGGSLAPTLTLANEVEAEIMSMGTIIVQLTAQSAIGDLVIYDNTTGVLETIAPGAVLPSGKSFANATVEYFVPTAPGLAVITLSPALVIPQPA